MAEPQSARRDRQQKKRRGGQLPMLESFLSFGAWQPDEMKIKLSERHEDLLEPGRCTIEVATVGFRQFQLLFPDLMSSRSLNTLLNEYLLSPRDGDGVPEPPPDELHKAMGQIVQERFDDSAETHTIFIDCRSIRSIRIPKDTDQHTGQHPLIVKSACDHVAMVDWLDRAITKIDVAVARARRFHKTGVRVVVYAARGITLAPCFALILHHILQACQFHPDIEIKAILEHYCRRIMEERQCGVCSLCSAQSATRSAALLNIRDKFRQLAVIT